MLNASTWCNCFSYGDVLVTYYFFLLQSTSRIYTWFSTLARFKVSSRAPRSKCQIDDVHWCYTYSDIIGIGVDHSHLSEYLYWWCISKKGIILWFKSYHMIFQTMPLSHQFLLSVLVPDKLCHMVCIHDSYIWESDCLSLRSNLANLKEHDQFNLLLPISSKHLIYVTWIL